METYAKDLKAKLGLSETPVLFSTIDRAISFARHGTKTAWIAMLDCPLAAIVYRPGDVTRLETAGYEVPFAVCSSLTVNRQARAELA